MKVPPHEKILPVAEAPCTSQLPSELQRFLSVGTSLFWTEFKNARYKGGGEERLTPIPYKKEAENTQFP